jgi:ABC-2 type transport system permease protein
LPESEFYALLYIPKTKVVIPETAFLYATGQPTLEVKSHIEGLMKSTVEDLKIMASGIDKEVLVNIKSTINLNTIKIDESGSKEESFTEVSMAIGYFLAFMIYMFIVIFGSQVMRGVLEEKTNRIVEVIVSSVKPFQLMTGKIIGVAMVGLTQIFLWVILTFGIYTVFTSLYADTLNLRNQQEMLIKQNTMSGIMDSSQQQAITDQINPQVDKIFSIIESINFGAIIGSFLFFFLGGYLLYSALFAAIGSAVDNETDTHQFMMPITIPLILAIIAAQFVVMNPDSSLSFWLSIIPFTSPVIMMIRIPFGVPTLDLVLSMIFLVAGFLATTWVAAKIYRTGILMYGKKINYKELWKWIRYHD